MNVSVLVCLAPGSEEIEAVTTIDLLVRAGIAVTTASVDDAGTREIVCSRGVRLLADTTFAQVANDFFDAIVLPGGLKGAERFRDTPLLIETLRQREQAATLVAAICAAPALVLMHHELYPTARLTGFPGLKDKIPQDRWQKDRVVFDASVNLLTSQGPGTSMEFALKLIALLTSSEKAEEVARQLVLPGGTEGWMD